MEPNKCSEMGFFSFDKLPEPMTLQTKNYMTNYLNSKI